MNQQVKRELKARFMEYASAYDPNDAKIKLKITHMLNVAEIAEGLARRLRLDDHMIELSYICGLYHDIGRFEQVRRYGTFADRKSVNHAELGCTIIQEENLLGFLTPEDAAMEITAISNHNKFAIDDGIEGDTLTLCKIIRDADKTDIFRVFVMNRPEETVDATIEEIESSEISDGVYECLMSCNCARSEIRKTPLDRLVGGLGFIFDINFDESVDVVLEQGFYQRIFDNIMPADKLAQERLAEILATTSSYMQSRTTQR